MRERLFVIAVAIVFGIPIVVGTALIPGDVWATDEVPPGDESSSLDALFGNTPTNNKAGTAVINQFGRTIGFGIDALAIILSGRSLWGPVGSGFTLTGQSSLEDEKSFASFSRQGPGMSAAAHAKGIGVWANVSYSNFDDDHPSTVLDGDTVSGFAGIDYQVLQHLILGVGIGYDNTDIDTTFNLGHTDTDAITGLAYAVVLVEKLPWLSFDFNVGYAGTDTDSDRITPAGVFVTGSNDGSRVFGGANANASFWFDNFNLGGNAGWTGSRSSTDRFTESNGTVVPSSDVSSGQFRVGARASYYWPLAQPFVSVTYEYDNIRNQVDVGPGQLVPSDDADDVAVGAGINFSITDRLSGGVDGSVILGRDNLDSFTVSGNVRFSF